MKITVSYTIVIFLIVAYIIDNNVPTHVNIAMVYRLLKFGISGLMYLSICLSGGRTGDASDSAGLCRPNSPPPE